MKALCQGDLDYEKVHKALMKMFGGDHRPNPKDFQRSTTSTDVFFEDEYDVEEEDGYYGEDDYNEWWEEEVNYYEEWQDDEPWPEELDEAADATEEAYISYLDSRRRMRELALSRGFYPVVAIGPEADGRSQSSKGKGSSKGNQKGKLIGKVKKPTRVRTSSPFVHEALHLKCQCQVGEHVRMEGRSKDLKKMQNYESGFTKIASEAIYKDMVNRWRNAEVLKIFMMHELDEMEINRTRKKTKASMKVTRS